MAAPEGPGRGGQQVTAGNRQLRADGAGETACSPQIPPHAGRQSEARMPPAHPSGPLQKSPSGGAMLYLVCIPSNLIRKEGTVAAEAVRALRRTQAPFHKHVPTTNMQEAPARCQAREHTRVRQGQVPQEGARHLRHGQARNGRFPQGAEEIKGPRVLGMLRGGGLRES